MATKQTLWDKYLQPVMERLIDREALMKIRREIDWEQESDRLRNPNLTYPTYYARPNFHGIKNGYLNIDAPVTYDAITQYVLLPQETWIRQSLIDAIEGYPARILDLGCGTGSATLMLKEAYAIAEVIGLDLSPLMLVMADWKAQKAHLDITWYHGLAEKTPWPNESFDLVTATLLFHETPPAITKAILQEAFRLLTPGGQCIILDGNQANLRQAPWIMEIFEEPYVKAFAAGNLEQWMAQAGFEQVTAQSVWWINQVTSAVKPLAIAQRLPRRIAVVNQTQENDMLGSSLASTF